MADHKGTLSKWILPSLLRDLVAERRTGLLSIEQGDARRTFRFRQGEVVGANSNVRDERVEERLVRAGLVNPAELEQVKAAAAREKHGLLDALEEARAVPARRLEQVATEQVRDVLLRVFSSGDGRYSYRDEEPPTNVDRRIQIATAAALIVPLRRVEDMGIVRYCLGDINRVPMLSDDARTEIQKLDLTVDEGYLLSRVDGIASAREIVATIPIEPDVALRSLMSLVAAGVVAWKPGPPKVATALPEIATLAAERGRARGAVAALPTPAPVRAEPVAVAPADTSTPRPPDPVRAETVAPDTGASRRQLSTLAARRVEILERYDALEKKDYHRLFGLPPRSTPEQIQAAYLGVSASFHPDNHSDPQLADLRAFAEAVFAGLSEAHAALTGAEPWSPIPPRPTAAPPVAAAPPAAESEAVEEALTHAKKLFAAGRGPEATERLEAVLALAAGEQRLRARLLLVNAYLRDPKLRRRGDDHCKRVTLEDPHNAEAHFVMGVIYKAIGARERAEELLRRALAIDPDHVEAVMELHPVPTEDRPKETASGRIRRFFGI